MKYTLLFMLLGFFSLTVQSQFGDLLKKAKEVVTGDREDLDIAGGLKEALEVGVDEAVASLSQDGGYFQSPYKILLPKEARKVVSTVSKVPGFTNIEKDLTKKMNEAAELAARKASPIFIQAIKEMSFKDASQILMGNQDAATQYLERTSRKKLYEVFLPVIQSALDEVNARDLWKSAIDAYNKIPFQKKLNPNLDDHVNNEALDGLFGLITIKEQAIRQNIALRTSPLLREVFARQDQ